MAQYDRSLLVSTPAGVAPPDSIPAPTTINATPVYGVLHVSSGRFYLDLAVAPLLAPETRVQILECSADAAPAATQSRSQINSTPAYGTWTGEAAGRLNFDLYGLLRFDTGLVTGTCEIVCAATMEIAASMVYSASATMAGATVLAIDGARLVYAAATMAGVTTLVIAPTRIRGGVVQMDGTTTLVIIVGVNGISLACFTGDGDPVVPEDVSPGQNYVF